VSLFVRLSILLSLASTVVACRGATSDQPPITPLRNMHDQQRYDPQAKSNFFPDGRTMRTPVTHTVSREEELSQQIGHGTLEDGTGYVMTIPGEVPTRLGGAQAMLERGQNRYNIYCRSCHDGLGTGQGMVVKRGMLQPPSLHDERIRTMPDGQLFNTISNGIRNMPAYGPTVPVDDRWAIVSYVRALELSRAKGGG
jgi:mono/diheme cytochrome c family protein